MTNGEKIRKMTDEELADVIFRFDEIWEEFCDDAVPKDEHLNCAIGDCRICALEWLEQETKAKKDGMKA